MDADERGFWGGRASRPTPFEGPQGDVIATKRHKKEKSLRYNAAVMFESCWMGAIK
ncbi:Unannotated [Lentimonas sp. CC4]|nr:Unannotated [Lentimonas sp. CC4]CAA6683543.1 Unannotated [Lentimonas sp. CC6]CAA7077304.1 Unannotated [Lentimonas sp. CC4]CAA7170181.1 Unannotated [Lentimonas sp. CC21]CAA7182431.1 Unannotated [Lentimonas sp. CC8]